MIWIIVPNFNIVEDKLLYQVKHSLAFGFIFGTTELYLGHKINLCQKKCIHLTY